MNESTAAGPRSKWLALLWALVLFGVSFTLNTRNNDFPYYYHPDEPGKVEQLQEGEWNFHHPMLLLSTTKLAASVLGTPNEPQALVQVGRDVSAAFTSLAIVAFALLAWIWRGWLSSFLTGVALVTHHQLYELSHYLKEDPALLAGIGVSFFAAFAYWQRPSPARALGVGAACALALSGKYIGAVVLGVALPVLLLAPATRNTPYRNLRPAAVGFLIVLLAVNWPMFTNLATFKASFSRELHLVATGQGEVTRSIPHALYWNVFVDNTGPVIWILLAAFLWDRWNYRNGLSLVEKLLIIFPFAFAIALSFSPKENDRYFLPVTAMLTFFAAMGVEDVPRLMSRFPEFLGWRHSERWLEPGARALRMVIATAFLVLVQLLGWWQSKPGWVQYDRAFQHDDHADLLAWMQETLPHTAVIAADARVGLPNPNKDKHAARVAAIPQKLLVKKFAADLGTLDELRKQGVTHVAISETSFGRFFRGNLRTKEENDRKFAARRAFYEQLFREGRRVFERERGTVIYLHPGILVYHIDDPWSAPQQTSL